MLQNDGRGDPLDQIEACMSELIDSLELIHMASDLAEESCKCGDKSMVRIRLLIQAFSQIASAIADDLPYQVSLVRKKLH